MSSAPLPGEAVHLLERHEELTRVERVVGRAAAGRGALVLLYGTSGIGLSSLLTACVERASAHGLGTLVARGSELERAYAFGMVRQLLEGCVPASALSELAGPVANAASADRFAQIRALHAVVAELVERRPLVLAVDDLQWCDEPSLDFLCFLAHRAAQLPLVIIGAWRRGEHRARAGRLQALAGEASTLFLTPRPLSEAAVRAVLANEFSRPVDGAAVAAVQARTAGQPFLVVELARALHEAAAPQWPPGAVEDSMPEPVFRHVQARLARQPEGVRRFAQAAAVLDDRASVSDCARLAELGTEKAQVAADALVRAGILAHEGSLSYVQPLVRSAVYAALSSVTRADLHARVARLWADRMAGADPERVAMHLLRTEPDADARFCRVLLAASHAAAGRGAVQLAGDYLRRALLERSDPGTRGDALAALGAIELRAGELSVAAQHLTEAVSLASTPSERVRRSIRGAEAASATRGLPAALELLAPRSADLEVVEPELRLGARSAALILALCHDPGHADVHEVLPASGAVPGDTPAQRLWLAACAALDAYSLITTAARVRDLCERALSVDPLFDPDMGAACLYFAGQAALTADAPDLVERAVWPESPAAGGVVPALRCQLALYGGDLPRAQAHAEEALRVIDRAPRSVLLLRIRRDVLAVRIGVCLERGGLGDADQALNALAGGGAGPRRAEPIVVALQAMVALARGEPSAALAACRQAAGLALPAAITVPGLCWREAAALVHLATGDSDGALRLAAVHLEQVRAWGAPVLNGRAARVHAAAGPHEARRAWLEGAAEILGDTPARLERARAHVDLGSAMRRDRHRVMAREQLVCGADLAHQCGAELLCERAREELLAAGARPRRKAFSGLEALTPSERRVAELAARKMTNREIARALTVSMKTVSGQLSAVYMKLDVHDRQALAELLGEGSGGREP